MSRINGSAGLPYVGPLPPDLLWVGSREAPRKIESVGAMGRRRPYCHGCRALPFCIA